ncbi:MAG: 2-C-methyl-D-erythritol 4-phosphate cytidylyltransferase [Steroidobacteraceae bacterium]
MNYWLVMPAAGAGSRFGADVPKQYLELRGRTVLERALAPFIADPRCQGIALALAAADPQRSRLAASLPAKVRLATGGALRSDSVLAGLAALPAATDDWVLVHDAARPLLSPRDLDALLAAGEQPQLPGALLAEAVADTLKRADAAGYSAATQERAALWRAQTPQMFRHGALRAALQAAQREGRQPTDEAQAMEWQGVHALLVAAQDPNFKITTRADLHLAAALLTSQSGADPAGGDSA